LTAENAKKEGVGIIPKRGPSFFLAVYRLSRSGFSKMTANAVLVLKKPFS